MCVVSMLPWSVIGRNLELCKKCKVCEFRFIMKNTTISLNYKHRTLSRDRFIYGMIGPGPKLSLDGIHCGRSWDQPIDSDFVIRKYKNNFRITPGVPEIREIFFYFIA